MTITEFNALDTRSMVRLLAEWMAPILAEHGVPPIPPERLELMADFHDESVRVDRLPCGAEWLRSAMLARIPMDRLADLVAEMRVSL